MEPLVNDLRSVLKRLNTYYEQLKAIKEVERQAVLDVNLEQLEFCNRKQDALHTDMLILEQERQRIVDQLAAQWQLEDGVVLNVSAMCERLPEKQGEQLRAVAERLSATVEEVRIANDNNRDLFSQSLEFVQDALQMMTGATNGGDGYSDRGRVQPPKNGPVVLDRKA